jgi:hypothetical protein
MATWAFERAAKACGRCRAAAPARCADHDPNLSYREKQIVRDYEDALWADWMDHVIEGRQAEFGPRIQVTSRTLQRRRPTKRDPEEKAWRASTRR